MLETYMFQDATELAKIQVQTKSLCTKSTRILIYHN